MGVDKPKSIYAMSERFGKNLSMSAFQYDLPDEKIARYPLQNRDESKLLVWEAGTIRETRYLHICEYLPPDSLLVFNNSKVIAARLLFSKPSGAVIEIFCLEPDNPEPGIHTAMLQKGKCRWKCLIGGASKWKKEQILEKMADGLALQARFVEKQSAYFIVEFSWMPAGLSFAEVLHLLGSIPLPPYLKRNAELADSERYQTIYAKEEGSVAAPTAGLHFTPRILNSLQARNIEQLYLTLHVGAGTFMPVKSEYVADHLMHEEFIEVSADRLQILMERLSRPVIAVGTTSLRTVESLYWLGLKIAGNPRITAPELPLSQWEPYHLADTLSAQDALSALLEWIRGQPGQKLHTRTQLFIMPGYRFKIIQGLISNFHQPQSTLLLLVAALIGEEWKRVYRFALEHEYRFLSYGDGCLFLPH
jgi:S-adenosylmethionine:tRNA ribosyltransferase-isomerase